MGNKEGVIIKRYANRRLYDTQSSRYVNLEILAKMIKAGDRVQVIDVKTKKDITKMILTQIILDKGKDETDGLPLELLFGLVKRGGSSYKKVMDDLFSIGPKAYDKAFDTVKSTLRSKSKKKIQASTDDEINELKQRLADVEAKLEASEKKDMKK